jgi:hypothetical protein
MLVTITTVVAIIACDPDQKACGAGCIGAWETCDVARAQTAAAKSPRWQAQFETDQALKQRRGKLRVGLLAPSIALNLAALGVLAFARRPAAAANGPVCMVGKRCGDSCIDASDTCHLSDGGRELTRAGWAAAGTLFALGVGLLVAALVAPRHLHKRQIVCGPRGCAFTIRF